ncbi:MAG: hypothetical protein IJ374_01060, partial [Lachnospiraceae bacterium]|nr:hypothetical protein [Lachnospiraceae bacterium]
IDLLATQFTHEKDSYDDQYDKDAPNTTVATVDELKSAIEEGKSVALASDLEINSVITFGSYTSISENKESTIDLMGNSLSFTQGASILQVMSGNTLNIIDTAENGILKIDATALSEDMGKSHTAPILAAADAVINLDGVNIEISGNTSSAIGTADGEVTINMNNCEVTVGDTCSAVHMENGILNMKNTKINMKSNATSAITVDQINKGNAVKLNLDNNNIIAENKSTPVVYIVRYDVDIVHSNLQYNGTTLYKTGGNGYTRVITVNGEVQE